MASIEYTANSAANGFQCPILFICMVCGELFWSDGVWAKDEEVCEMCVVKSNMIISEIERNKQYWRNAGAEDRIKSRGNYWNKRR
jgi:hypothetical protein